ncbi:(deoxy)nucleoside triphosphate pyrophosphohydrolase [Chryseomicrobium sp. FSL W7-1435]|uniref:(deoxy)nucleoside triphosphate pyrophosphohydrolase n=1 Tax=Chryseomicrobium sp. FSL W7-1435 TaxID=2921704 RepID=UPI00315B2680
MKKHVNVVGAVLVNETKQIFCALRSPQMSLPNLWEFPGGKIEPGESPEETLKRELMEELKIEVTVGEEVESTYYEYDSFTIQLTTFYTKIQSGTPILTEHADYKWLSAEELFNLEWAPADIPAVHKIQKQFNTKGIQV